MATEHEVAEHLDRLDQRRRWLTERIGSKQRIGWQTDYDVSERDALAWALERLTGVAPEKSQANG